MIPSVLYYARPWCNLRSIISWPALPQGTLGLDPANVDPSVPRFSSSSRFKYIGLPRKNNLVHWRAAHANLRKHHTSMRDKRYQSRKLYVSAQRIMCSVYAPHLKTSSQLQGRNWGRSSPAKAYAIYCHKSGQRVEDDSSFIVCFSTATNFHFLWEMVVQRPSDSYEECKMFMLCSWCGYSLHMCKCRSYCPNLRHETWKSESLDVIINNTNTCAG